MLLSALIFLPLVFAGVLAFCPKEKIVQPIALVFSGLLFALSIIVFINFDPNTAGLQFTEKRLWIPQLGINYFVGIDGISLWLVLLSNFLLPLVIIGSAKSVTTKIRSFYAALFILQSSMIGSFLALDLILFYIFFESSLIPMAMMIGIWGGDKKIYASFKFFIYTMFGSVFMLTSIVCLMLINKSVTGVLSSDVLELYKLDIAFIDGRLFSTQTILFLGFAIAFAIKVPMFPVHTWLPDAHVQAPTPGSVILAGVMLKMGTYGFMRFAIPLFPEASTQLSWVFSLLAVIGIIYGALVAMVQTDIKKLVAYSSVSHMGYIILGLFTFNEIGMTGSLYQMLNHGLSTGALFFLVGMIYDRTHTREISAYGGLAKVLPLYSIFFLVITFSSIAVPMTNGFVGEFYILLGTYLSDPVWSALAVSGVILGATYMLWMIKKVFFGEVNPSLLHHHLKDLSRSEYCVLVPIVIFVFWMGLFPNHFLKYSQKSVSHLTENLTNYELTLKNPNSSTETLASKKINNF